VTLPVFGIREQPSTRRSATAGRSAATTGRRSLPTPSASIPEKTGHAAQYRGIRVTPGDPKELIPAASSGDSRMGFPNRLISDSLAAGQDRPRGPGGVQKNFCEAVAAAVPEAARGKPLEVWFQDEARVGQQGTLTRVWAKRGTRPRAPRDTRYQWAYIFGAVCPDRGVAAGLVMPFADTGAMNDHLAEIARTVAPGAHAVLVLDGAGWHGGHALVVPDNVSLLVLPPYSPELNPVENVWQYLRANWLAISVFDDYDAIVDACCHAWNHFAEKPETVSSITSRHWPQVNP
jgi:hypothetical protein